MEELSDEGETMEGDLGGIWPLYTVSGGNLHLELLLLS